MARKIFILSGLPGTGKSSFAEELRNLGITVKKYSEDVIDPMLLSEGMPINRKNEIEYGNSLREVYGDNVLSELVDVQITTNIPLAIDGSRKLGEVRYFQQKYGRQNVYSIVFRASYKIRLGRMRYRGTKEEDSVTYQELRRIDAREGQEIGKITREADLIVNTDNLPREFYAKLARALVE